MFKDIENLLQKSCRMLVVGGFLCACGMASAQSITRMRCEYGVRPLCIDVSTPRLTWNFLSKNDLQQRQYRVVVGTDSVQLLNEKPSLEKPH